MKKETILLIKNRAFGDSVMGLSAVSYIKELYPESKIIYGVPKWVAPLYKNLKGPYDEILPIELKSIFDWVGLWIELRAKKVDFIFEMHLGGRSKKFFSLFSKIMNVPYFFHNHHEMKKKTGVKNQGVIKPLIQRDLDGVYSYLGKKGHCPCFLDYTPKLSPKKRVDKNGSVVFGVVATRETKKWFLENFIHLAEMINKSYPHLKIVVPLSRDADDLLILKKLKESKGLELKNWSLSQLPEEMAKSSIYIGNDTGLKHLAISLGIKSYTFFGPEPPNEWHPYRREDHPYFYLEKLECRTLQAHYCGLSDCETMFCMEPTTSEKVFEAIRGDLNGL